MCNTNTSPKLLISCFIKVIPLCAGLCGQSAVIKSFLIPNHVPSTTTITHYSKFINNHCILQLKLNKVIKRKCFFIELESFKSNSNNCHFIDPAGEEYFSSPFVFPYRTSVTYFSSGV